MLVEFAQKVIAEGRRLHSDDALELELDQTVYALDSTTIDLCLSLFSWARVGQTRSILVCEEVSRTADLHCHRGGSYRRARDVQPRRLFSASWETLKLKRPGRSGTRERPRVGECPPDPDAHVLDQLVDIRFRQIVAHGHPPDHTPESVDHTPGGGGHEVAASGHGRRLHGEWTVRAHGPGARIRAPAGTTGTGIATRSTARFVLQ
jgi:hypothetical protein